jgi:hypothetical protein
VEPAELYEICQRHLGDLDAITMALRRWLTANPERLDDAL